MNTTSSSDKDIHVLLTGFEPFGPYAYNPVQDVAKFFDGERLGKMHIKGVVLSSIYDAFHEIKGYLQESKPNIVLGMGLASRVKGIRMETVGNNVRHSDYADAKGQLIHHGVVEQDGPQNIALNTDAYSLSHLLQSSHIPVEISRDAEGFICNDLIYQTARYIQQNQLDIHQCFIHTPWTDDYLHKVDIEHWKMKISKEMLIDSVKILLTGLSEQISSKR